jgi:hypothetical protein
MNKTAVLIILCTISFHVAAGNDLFGQPQRLCSVLASEELRAKGGWKPNKAIPGEWSCTTTFIPFGTVGSNGMENNIAFYVHGTNPSRANDIRIKVNVNNAKERNQAFARLNSAAKTLFKAISQPIPPELSKAISQQKPVSLNTPFGKIELLLKPGEKDSFRIVLKITHSPSAKKQTRADTGKASDSYEMSMNKATDV